MKRLPNSKIAAFAIGQLGWSMMSGLISNWLVYFYQPDAAAQASGQTLFVPQGRVILGIFTIIGAITALGRIFDAVTDPWIASLSDRCKSPAGRRIPFLKWAAPSTGIVYGPGILCAHKPDQRLEYGMAVCICHGLLPGDHGLLYAL